MHRRTKQTVLVVAALVFLSVLIITTLNMLSKPPNGLGDAKQLAQCPDTPNCVCSQAERDSQRIPPIAYSGSAAQAIDVLKQIIGEMPRSKLVVEDAGYLHFEFRSFLFRFVDDVELLIDEENSIVHLRSASRVGYSDFGVNRRRMEEIRQRFTHSDQGSSNQQGAMP